jgi:predicted CoA-binding protein
MKNEVKETVAVLGASSKPERYSNQAVKLLQKKGYRVVPVHPAAANIEGLEVATSLEEIDFNIDTLTLYIAAHRSSAMLEDILVLNPGRVIFNPGTENPLLQKKLEERGISTQEACTLVLLNTGQF